MAGCELKYKFIEKYQESSQIGTGKPRFEHATCKL